MATKNDLRDVAQTLFMQGYSQKEIAKKLGKAEQTVSRWSKEENWKTKKTNILMSKDSRLSELYEELNEFNRMIKAKEGFKIATAAEADARRKLIRDIKDLETKYNLAETIQIGLDLTAFIRETDFDTALIVLNWYDSFVENLIKKQKWGEKE